MIPTGASYCPERSRSFVEAYGSGKYELHLSHEPSRRAEFAGVDTERPMTVK